MRWKVMATVLLSMPILLSVPMIAAANPALGTGGTHDAPNVAWATPNADYPLKVHVLSADRTHHHRAGIYSTDSYGSGNLLGAPQIGFDYNSTCEGGFLHNAQSAEFYQGRWKVQDRKIEILVVTPGESKPQRCEISVTLKAAPYTHDNPPPHLTTAK